MALTIGDFTRSRLKSTPIEADLSKAELLNTVSAKLNKQVDTSLTEWREAKVAEAKAAGTKDGLTDKEIEWKTLGTHSNDAYNKSAMSSLELKTKKETTMQMAELSRIYADQPELFLAESKKIREKIVGSLKSNPMTEGLAAATETEMALQQETYLKPIANAHYNNVRAEHIEILDDSLDIERLKAEAAGAAMYSDDPEEAANGLNQLNESVKQVDLLTNGIDPGTGRRYFNTADKMKRKQEVMNNFFTAGINTVAADPSTSPEIIGKILTGTYSKTFDIGGQSVEFNARNEIGAAAYETKVVKPLKARIKARNTAYTNLNKEVEANIKKEQSLLYSTLAAEMHTNTVAYTPDQINKMDISESQKDKLMKMYGEEPAEYTDPTMLGRVQYLINDGRPAEAVNYMAQNAKDFSQKDYRTNMNLATKDQNTNEARVRKASFDAYDSVVFAKANPYGKDRNIKKRKEAAIIQKQIRDNSVEAGTSPEIADEILLQSGIRMTADFEANDESDFFDVFSKYMIIGSNGQLNYEATLRSIEDKKNRGSITQEMYDTSKDKLAYYKRKYNPDPNIENNQMPTLVNIEEDEERGWWSSLWYDITHADTE